MVDEMADLAAEILAGVAEGTYRETAAIMCACDPHRRNKAGRFYAGPMGSPDARHWFVTNPFRRPGTTLGTVPPAAAHVPREGELAWTLPTECRRCHRVFVVMLGGCPDDIREAVNSGTSAWIVIRFQRPTTEPYAAGDDVETIEVTEWRAGPHGCLIGAGTAPQHGRVAP